MIQFSKECNKNMHFVIKQINHTSFLLYKVAWLLAFFVGFGSELKYANILMCFFTLASVGALTIK